MNIFHQGINQFKTDGNDFDAPWLDSIISGEYKDEQAAMEAILDKWNDIADDFPYGQFRLIGHSIYVHNLFFNPYDLQLTIEDRLLD